MSKTQVIKEIVCQYVFQVRTCCLETVKKSFVTYGHMQADYKNVINRSLLFQINKPKILTFLTVLILYKLKLIYKLVDVMLINEDK